MTESRGILYIAMGEGFAKEANISARSVKENHGDIPITLRTDQERELDNIDEFQIVDDPEYGFSDKPRNMRELPYDRTLFLDTDVFIYSDITEVFEILDAFDVAATHAKSRFKYDFDDVPISFPAFSTGVMCMKRNEAVSRLLTEWRLLYRELRQDGWTPDQASFRKVVYESDLRVATLPPEYNTVIKSPGYVSNEAKIIHSRLLDIDSPGSKKPLGLEVKKGAKKLNKKLGKRVYYGNPEIKVKHFDEISNSLVTRIYYSLKYRGISDTFKKVCSKFL